MSNRRLRVCPKCGRELDVDGTREAMGLNSGRVLNFMCPGSNGPSDIDHILHNRETDRVAAIEYKLDDAPLTGGQEILLEALTGEWVELATDRKLSIRYWVIPTDASEDEALESYSEAVEWVWPGVDWRTTYHKLAVHAENHPHKITIGEIEAATASVERYVERLAGLIAEFRD